MNRNMRICVWSVGVLATGSLLAGVLVQAAPPKKNAGEHERVVKESEVPPAALEALKKLAAGAKIAKFEMETEHGATFFEAEWSIDGGKMEACVTEHGELMEIEETVSESATPKAVAAAARTAAGEGAAVRYEKKTVFVYEAKFTKAGKRHEIILTPDGRQHHEADEDDDGDADDED